MEKQVAYNLFDISKVLMEHLAGTMTVIYISHFKDALSGMRKFVATESPFKMMKNAFYFTLKALFFPET